MKLLSIGNSFSEDAHKWLHDIAISDGFNLDTVNLCVGGCSLERHYKYLTDNEPIYAMQGNGGNFIRKSTIMQALKEDEYDIITLQQVSGLSGKYETYLPYIVNIMDVAKKHQPNAVFFLHRTWSYETDCEHSSFKNYDNNQIKMFDEICLATQKISKMIDARIIPVGDAIQMLREKSNHFIYKDGGISLCRDGFHLTFDYGRFVAGAVWYKTFTGKTVNIEKFVDMHNQFDVSLLNEIIECVSAIEV